MMIRQASDEGQIDEGQTDRQSATESQTDPGESRTDRQPVAQS